MTEGVEWICQAYSGRTVELAEAFLIVISCQPAISLVAKWCCGFVSKVNYRDAGGIEDLLAFETCRLDSGTAVVVGLSSIVLRCDLGMFG